jgi:hypothetical protein
VDNIVFIYDKSKSSVFAIKQFTYLFPQFKGQNAKVIYINEKEALDEEDKFMVMDWLQYHYRNVECISLEGNATKAFFNFLVEKKSDFVVMGGYGHGLLSSFVDYHAANEANAMLNVPIFISHY